MTKRIHHCFISVLLAIGLVFSAILLSSRLSAEQGANLVSAAVYYDDVLRLAEESNRSTEEWLDVFSANGVCYIVFETEPSEITLTKIAPYNLEPAGYIGDSSAFALSWVSWPEEGSTPLALVENSTRTAVFFPDGFDLNGYEGALVKTLYLNDYYASRYTVATGAKEVENIIFRGVVERGLRLVLLRPFVDETGFIVTDSDDYVEVLNSLSNRLSIRGLTLGRTFSCMDTEPQRPMLLAGAGCLVVGLWLCLFLYLLPKTRRLVPALGCIAVLCLFAGCYVMPGMAQKLLMLLCAIVFPCLGMCMFKRLADALKTQTRPAWLKYLITLLYILPWSILGGLLISAFMSDRCYLMGSIMFSGVKVSQMIPLAFSLVYFGTPVAKDLVSTPMTRSKMVSLVSGGLLLILAGVILVIRSGDVARISSLETQFRAWMEDVLYVRPRTKELVLAVPFLALLFTKLCKKNSVLYLFASLCCCLECVSVTNTFCHAVTPIYISLIRTLLTAGIGMVLGLCLQVACNLLSKSRLYRDEM